MCGVVSLPDGLDPDDFVKKYGPVGMRDAMEKAYTLMEFKLEMLRLGAGYGKRKRAGWSLPSGEPPWCGDWNRWKPSGI